MDTPLPENMLFWCPFVKHFLEFQARHNNLSYDLLHWSETVLLQVCYLKVKCESEWLNIHEIKAVFLPGWGVQEKRPSFKRALQEIQSVY